MSACLPALALKHLAHTHSNQAYKCCAGRPHAHQPAQDAHQPGQYADCIAHQYTRQYHVVLAVYLSLSHAAAPGAVNCWLQTMHLRAMKQGIWQYNMLCAPEGILKRIFVPEGGSTLTWPLAHMYRQHTLVAEFLLSQAHADFDPETFREGVKQAIEYSTQLYAASDWVSLKPLVSTALLQSMQHARQQQASMMDADDVTLSDVELVIDPESVRLVSASAITREQLSSLDQQRAGEALPLVPVGADDEESATVDAAASAAAGAAHSATASPVAEGAADLAAWDVAHVYAEGVLRANVRKGDGPAKQVELFKRGHWVLGRGPVHIDRVLSAEVVDKTPWFLLSWL